MSCEHESLFSQQKEKLTSLPIASQAISYQILLLWILANTYSPQLLPSTMWLKKVDILLIAKMPSMCFLVNSNIFLSLINANWNWKWAFHGCSGLSLKKKKLYCWANNYISSSCCCYYKDDNDNNDNYNFLVLEFIRSICIFLRVLKAVYTAKTSLFPTPKRLTM